MPLPFAINWKAPDYGAILEWRVERLRRLRADPTLLPALKVFYRQNPAQFIIDWGQTFDPRAVEVGRASWMPFLLFPKQEEWVGWFLERWLAREPGLTEKSRDMGMSWLTVATAATICMFRRGIVAGFGSRKEDYVDKIGDPKSLFWKAREFVAAVPREFRAGWTREKHAPHMRLLFPDTGSAMTGEAGDNIGRGDRTSFFVVDESAHLEHPELVDASLSATTNCRQDLSSVNGMGNSFAVKRHSGNIKVFTFHWRDDPRKDEAWYEKQKRELDAVTVAQEIDINYSASVSGVLIPSEWAQAAVGALEKLGLQPTGRKRAGLDVADEGVDKNALAMRNGVELQHLEQWSGLGSDIFQTVEKAFLLADTTGCELVDYDADGLGSGVRGDSRVINERRVDQGGTPVDFQAFRGSGAVHDPEGEMVPKRLNQDFFANLKAQSWWALRLRFQATFRALQGGDYQPDEIISLRADLPLLAPLLVELSQPTYTLNGAGKVVVNKQPDGMKSPNLADAVMIAYQPASMQIERWLRLGA